MKKQINWNEKNKQILIQHYPSGGTKQVLKYINSTPNSIKSAAKRFKIKYDKNFGCFNKLKPLLEENNFNYYWSGFCMADGNFSLTGNSNLRVKISVKDEDHLKILANYLNVNIKYRDNINYNEHKCMNSCEISIGDSINAKKIIDLFDINQNKTINPPNLNCLNTKEKFLSFLCGFIDGDGSICQNNNLASMIRIQCHVNWLKNLEFFSENLKKYLNINSRSYVDKQGYARFVIFSFNQLKKLKIEILKLEVPFLNRKWSKIDEMSKDIFKSNDHVEKFKYLYEIEGKTLVEISQIFQCSISPILRLKKKLKSKRNNGNK